jgi:hypothetical protein
LFFEQQFPLWGEVCLTIELGFDFFSSYDPLSLVFLIDWVRHVELYSQRMLSVRSQLGYLKAFTILGIADKSYKLHELEELPLSIAAKFCSFDKSLIWLVYGASVLTVSSQLV